MPVVQRTPTVRAVPSGAANCGTLFLDHFGEAFMPKPTPGFTDILNIAIAEADCTVIGCTTCGAARFRTRLHRLCNPDDDPATFASPPLMNAVQAETLLAALPSVPAEYISSGAARSAVRLVLFLVWNALGGDIALPQMRDKFRHSAAGEILHRMEQHSAAIAARRSADTPAGRLRRKADRAERHAERLRQKALRD